jgi:SAM-dependent methyltransferase
LKQASTRLPERYALDWLANFYEKIPALQPGATVLDIGSGRKPAIPVDQRPDFCRYIGLDLSAPELDLAGPGAYSEKIVSPVEQFSPELESQVDVAVSWQVIEHVDNTAVTIDNIYRYLKPGGAFVAMLSGRNAAFAMINRVIPEPVGKFAMAKLLRRPPDTVFRAKYDDCTFSELIPLFERWQDVDIESHFRGAAYFRFLRPVQSAYLAYENRLLRDEELDRATHYLVRAVK